MVDRFITRAGWSIARIEPQGRMKRITLLDGTFYAVCSKGRYLKGQRHPCDVIVHPDFRWHVRLYRAFF